MYGQIYTQTTKHYTRWPELDMLHLCLGLENHTQYLWSASTLIIFFNINFPHGSDKI